MTDKIKKTCDCDCLDKQATDPSRRDFIRKASTLTLIGGSAFILEACGGGGSPTSSGGDTYGGGDTGGGNNGGGSGDTGYNYDVSTGVITINITMIYETLQTVGNGIALSGSDTFDNRGIIVLRTSNSGVRALSRNCTHAGFTVNINNASNNLICPSHNSVFDFNGNVISGPASGSLTRYQASLNADSTIITITQG